MTTIAWNLQVDAGPEGYLVTRRKKGLVEKTTISHRDEPSLSDVHFINSIKSGELIRKDVASYEEGMKTLEMGIAVALSAKTHKPVSLPLS